MTTPTLEINGHQYNCGSATVAELVAHDLTKAGWVDVEQHGTEVCYTTIGENEDARARLHAVVLAARAEVVMAHAKSAGA